MTEGGVTPGFDDDESDTLARKLVIISRFNPSVLVPEEPVRQVAIRIPENVHELLRQEAKVRRISIASLCSEWIIEKVNGAGRQKS